MNDQEILQRLTEILIEEFEVDENALTPDARLYEDLGIDSIDAVDLVVQLKDQVGKRIPPEDFKNVRTLQDVVAVIGSAIR